MRAWGLTLLMVVLAGCQASGNASAPVDGDATASEAAVLAQQDDPRVQVSAPEAGSPRGKALAAMARADDFTLYSLKPYEPPFYPDDAPAYGSPGYEDFSEKFSAAEQRKRDRFCLARGCVAGNEILGSTAVRRADDLQAVRTALHESLAQIPNFATACVPAYRHAIGFHAGGTHYQILLCYECGKVNIVADGNVLGYDDQAYDMGDEAALNAILVRERIALPD